MKHNSNDMDKSNKMDGGRDYEHVNLGLPSGTLWATCNVGATSPEQAGLYFAWGETEGYTADEKWKLERVFFEENYKGNEISSDLTLEQDAAHAYMGGEWRMPTKDEWQELIDNCNVTWVGNFNKTMVAGNLFTSKVNGNSVFFPAAGSCGIVYVIGAGQFGDYWSATYLSKVTSYDFYFDSKKMRILYDVRHYGRSVRGVWKSK